MDKVIGKLKIFNKSDWTKVIATGLAVLFALFSVVYFAIQTEWDDMALSFLAIVYAIAPLILERLFRFRAQPVLFVFAIIYTICPLLGSSYKFYLIFWWWDDVLHAFAGLLFAMFGAYLPYVLSRRKPRLALCALMAFVFSLAVSGVWEFIEFGFDSLFGTDMQKDTLLTSMRPSYLFGKLLDLPEGTLGPSGIITNVVITYADGTISKIPGGYLDIGLLDSMHDMLIETLGAFVYTVVYVAFKGKKFTLVPMKNKKKTVGNQVADPPLLQEVAVANTSVKTPVGTPAVPEKTQDVTTE